VFFRPYDRDIRILKFLSFLASRLWKALGVILGVIVFNFFLIRLAPGDPASIMAGEAASSDPAYVEQLRQQFGLISPSINSSGSTSKASCILIWAIPIATNYLYLI